MQYQPTLHRLPDDTAGRFRVLREFLRAWHGLDTGTVGRTVDRVARAEAKLGLPLPLAVREWIVLLDDLARLDAWDRVLRDAWSLDRVPGCPAFSLLVQGEADRHWGPMLRDLKKSQHDDPPTSTFVLDLDDPSRFVRAGQVAPRVSTWALEFIVGYLYLGWCAQLELAVHADELGRLTTRPGVVHSRLGKLRLFEFAGGLVHTLPDEPTPKLRAYAPFAAGDHAAARPAEHALRERLAELLDRPV